MSKSAILFYVWLAAVLQAWFFSALGFTWLMPNIVLVLLVLITLNKSVHFALAMAVWSGFWLDLAAFSYFGFNMLTYSLAVGFIVMLKNTGIDFNFKPSLVVTSVVGALIISVTKLLLLIGGSVGWGGFAAVVGTWVLQAICTGLVMMIVSDYLTQKFSTKNLMGVRA